MYAIFKNNVIIKYPVYDLRQEFLNYSFPDPINNNDLPENVVYILQTDPPEFDARTHKVIESSIPEFNNGVWQTSYQIQPLSDLELYELEQQLKNQLLEETKNKLDAFAQTRMYDNILSACTYATSSIPKFQQEGQRCVDLRDATWTKLYEIFNEITAGTRPQIRDYIEIENELPVLVW